MLELTRSACDTKAMEGRSARSASGRVQLRRCRSHGRLADLSPSCASLALELFDLAQARQSLPSLARASA